MIEVIENTLADLPVNTVLHEIVESYSEGKIPIVTSVHPSGKTLLIPISCADRLQDVIYVLEPTRFLANHSAEKLIDLLGDDNQNNLIGRLNGSRSDDDSYTHQDNLVIFTTYGYAMASGIIHTETNFVFDEANDTSIDLSLAKAIIHRRMENERINLALLASNIDIENELGFWGEDAIPIQIDSDIDSSEGDLIEAYPSTEIERFVYDLIVKHDRKGILIFVEGKDEINRAITAIEEELAARDIEGDMGIHISSLHGNSSYEERLLAMEWPTMGDVKILVGTSVMEAGIWMPWADTAVSTGCGKVLQVNGNNKSLQIEKLSRQRLVRQNARLNVGGYNENKLFYLIGHDKDEVLPVASLPDIQRLPTTELVMTSLKFPSINIRDLIFSENEQPSYDDLDGAAHELMCYGLVEQTEEEDVLCLTESGRMASRLPLSFGGMAGFCEALLLEAVPQVIPIIALLEVGDVRRDTRKPIGGTVWERSDVLTQVYSICQFTHGINRSPLSFREQADAWNLNIKKYREFNKLVQTLERTLEVRADFEIYLNTDPVIRRKVDRAMRRVIFRSMFTSRYYFSYGMVNANPIGDCGHGATTAVISKSSVCYSPKGSGTKFITGRIRHITPMAGSPFNITEMVTSFDEMDIEYLKNRWSMEEIDPSGRFSVERKVDVERLNRPHFPSVTSARVGSFGALLAGVINK